MNLNDVLYMKNTGKVKEGAELFDILLAKKLSGGGVVTTITGNPLAFVTRKAQKAISTKITMFPMQSGSGDPSPTNVRPITGRTSVKLDIKDSEQVTQDEITISFGQTVYGGTVDLETGVLTVDRGYYRATTDKNWAQGGSQTSAGFYRYYITPIPAMKNGSNQNGLCDKLPTGSVSSQVVAAVFGYGNQSINILSTATTINDFKAELTNTYGGYLDLVYPLATPTTIQLTPSEVQLLKGANTVWTDGDTIELTYKA